MLIEELTFAQRYNNYENDAGLIRVTKDAQKMFKNAYECFNFLK